MGAAADTATIRRSVADALTAVISRSGRSTGTADAATRAVRRVRAAQIDELRLRLADGTYRSLGHRSPTDWLAATTHESIGHCKHTVTLVERLPKLPAVEAAFRDGDLAESAVRLLVEAWRLDIADAFDRDGDQLLEWARTLTHRDLRLVIDTWRQCVDQERCDAEAADRFDRRELIVTKRPDGVGHIDGTLDPEGFALVRDALRTLSTPNELDGRTLTQRRADALVTMARITLDVVGAPVPTEPTDGGTRPKRNRPKVIATIPLTDLITGTGGGVIDTQLDTITTPSEAIRRLCCDAGIHRYVSDPHGTVIDHGRQQRTVSDRQFERLHIRDHGCRWPGCGVPAAGCDAHHAVHWLDLGETNDDNLTLLCWFHHHLLHEQHWSIEPHGGGNFTLRDPNGMTHQMRPPLVGLDLHAA